MKTAEKMQTVYKVQQQKTTKQQTELKTAQA